MDNFHHIDTKQFINLSETFEFMQHVTGPTHKQGYTLDQVISKGLNITVKGILD